MAPNSFPFICNQRKNDNIKNERKKTLRLSDFQYPCQCKNQMKIARMLTSSGTAIINFKFHIKTNSLKNTNEN
jgi:hypothetical protein